MPTELRTEQIHITKEHILYKTIEDYCIRSNNLYNYANYIVRQEYIKNHNWIRYQELQKLLKDSEPYKKLMSQASQCTLQVLDRCWKSYFQGIKSYNKNRDKFLGEPKIPKYRIKGAKFTWFLKNNQTYIKDGRLYFMLKCMNGYSFKTKANGRLIAVRFVPKNGIFILEIIYEHEILEKLEYNNRIASIDLGVNNFVTMTNNIGLPPVIINGKGIKSLNQFYNKQRAKMVSSVQKINKQYWSKRLDTLNRKRFNRIKNFIHTCSKQVLEYCYENNIENLVIGHNDTWKQECSMGNKNNQNFVFIPYNMFIEQCQYKSNDYGIKVIVNEESYTSGTSFIDNEQPTKEFYNKKRRVKRGLFQTNSGHLINSDVNGSFQIMIKVFPNAFNEGYGIVGGLTPTVFNVCKI
jgi:putative transposase